ncbi:MAG: DUF1761 domain-containing protein [Patescibacteria group bacterium]|nr:DUF1761 domain-containing protein [Patescibacteria group bacterium]MDE2172348.1 DUF1761 domain-containing protein [Patescibacteria group bacterium]
MNTINLWPILIASAVAFAIGAIWYSPILFGREWQELTKTSDAEIAAARASGMWKRYITQFIATIVAFCVLAFLAAAANLTTFTDGAFLGFLVWLGFSATEATSGLLWEKKPFKLVLIQSVGSLVTLVVGGAIIGAW